MSAGGETTGPRRALITGGLGGLGTTLALCLRARGDDVTCADVFHPGCAPFVVFAHRRQLLEQAGARVVPADMRAPALAERLLGPARGEGRGDSTWYHVASPPPPGVAGVPPAAYRELAREIPARWAAAARERGWECVIVQHVAPPDDPRPAQQGSAASELPAAEADMRREFPERAGLRYGFAAALFGLHQSPHTPPLRDYLRALSRMEGPEFAPARDFRGVALEQFVDHLLAGGDGRVAPLQQPGAELVTQWATLPWVPPADWPRAVSRRR